MRVKHLFTEVYDDQGCESVSEVRDYPATNAHPGQHEVSRSSRDKTERTEQT